MGSGGRALRSPGAPGGVRVGDYGSTSGFDQLGFGTLAYAK
jgi:hypothetical protein